VQQDLLDLVRCEPDAKRRTDVHGELLLPPERDEGGERDAAAVFRSRPGLAQISPHA
jgi:hypothetical protein